jgi:hypothetical protein
MQATTALANDLEAPAPRAGRQQIIDLVAY